MFVVLGPLLLVLAAIGIYAVVAYPCRSARRKSASASRSAPPPRGRRQIVGESLRVVGVGALAGWAIAFLIAFTYSGPLYLSAFLGVPAVLLLVAAFASWLPARRRRASIR